MVFKSGCKQTHGPKRTCWRTERIQLTTCPHGKLQEPAVKDWLADEARRRGVLNWKSPDQNQGRRENQLQRDVSEQKRKLGKVRPAQRRKSVSRSYIQTTGNKYDHRYNPTASYSPISSHTITRPKNKHYSERRHLLRVDSKPQMCVMTVQSTLLILHCVVYLFTNK